MPTIDRSITFPVNINSTLTPDPGSPVTSYNGHSFGCTRVKSGIGMPYWKQKIKAGQDATTPFSGRFDSAEIERGACSWSYSNPNAPFGGNGAKGEDHGDLVFANGVSNPTFIPPSIDISATDSAARGKFYKELRSRAVQVSGPTFLGELRETVHMIKRPAGALYSKAHGYLDALSKSKRSNPKAWLQNLSGLWLEQSFGWAPLIKDLEDGAKAWERAREPRFQKGINKSFKETKDTTSALPPEFRGQSSIQLPSGVRILINGECTDEANVRYKGAIKAQADATPWDNWALFGFTPSEFVPTAWELLPWSFLIDYFTNIGDILTALVTDTTSVVYAVRTQRTKTTFAGRPSWYDSNALKSAGWIGGGTVSGCRFKLERKDFTRASVASVSLPTFRFDMSLGQGQLLNIAALLGQARALHPQRNTPHYHR